jgi:3-hydroxybutyryl-CoA dehydrogenase
MAALDRGTAVGIVGAGAMGAGIAQVAATAGHPVRVIDARHGIAAAAKDQIRQRLDGAVAKGRLDAAAAKAALDRIHVLTGPGDLAGCGLVIEAIVEDLAAKRRLLAELEHVLAADAILASNTSSLSITAMGAALRDPSRLVGMHFFNPAPVMELVEVVSGLATAPGVAATVADTAAAWGKAPVRCRSTPGFIVNRVARPFYGEALRLIAEGAADAATIDALMREAGGFRMGPLELTDLIGQDVNHAVTRSVFQAYDGDPRYQPSLVQRELIEAGRLGRKSGRGFYDYREGAARPRAATEPPLAPPAALLVEGDPGPLGPLVERIAAAGVPVRRGAGDGRLAVVGAVLRLVDGRSATVRGAALGEPLVHVDLALDYATCTRLAVAVGLQVEPAGIAAATGLLQATGIAVSALRDTAGLVVMRTVAMLANEAADAARQGIAASAEIDTAMMKGVNYPKGPLQWAEGIGLGTVLAVLDGLARTYGEDRYRASPLLRDLVAAGRSRFDGG